MLALSGRFDDKYQALQGQLSENLGISKTNGIQIATLVDNQGKMLESQAKMEKAIIISSTMNKFLWPVVTASAAIIATLITAQLHL